MAAREIKATIKLDGEQKFKTAVKGAKTELSALRAELKAQTAQFKAQGDAQGEAAARAENLRKQQEQQAEIVRALEQALKEANEKFGEGSAQAQNYRIQLANAQTALANLTSAANDAADAAAGVTMDGSEIADSAEDGANGLDAITDRLDEIAGHTAFSAMVDGIGLVVNAANTAYDSVKKVYDLVNNASNWADDLATLSITSGIDTTTLQQMNYASKLVDTDVETIISSVKKLRLNMDDGKKMKPLAEILGVSAYGQDGKLKDALTLFNEIVASANKMGIDLTKDTAAANVFADVLGKSADELQPLISGYQQYLEAMEQADKSGMVLGEDEVKNLTSYNDGLQTLTTAMETLERVFASTLSPLFGAFNEGLTETIQNITEWLRDSDVAASIESVTKVVGDVMGMISKLVGGDISFQDLLDKVSEWLSGDSDMTSIGDAISSTVSGFFASLATTISTILSNVDGTEIGSTIGDFTTTIFDALASAASGLFDFATSPEAVKMLADITSFVEDLFNAVIEKILVYIDEKLGTNLSGNFGGEDARAATAAAEAVGGYRQAAAGQTIDSYAADELRQLFNWLYEGARQDRKDELADGIVDALAQYLKGGGTAEGLAAKAYADIEVDEEFTEKVQTELDGHDFTAGIYYDPASKLPKEIQDTINSQEYTAKVNLVTSAANIPMLSIPGHADGLDSVPYDNYIARLHKGETVLTASQAKVYREGGMSEKALDDLAARIASAMGGISVNMDGRAVGMTVAPTINEMLARAY